MDLSKIAISLNDIHREQNERLIPLWSKDREESEKQFAEMLLKIKEENAQKLYVRISDLEALNVKDELQK